MAQNFSACDREQPFLVPPDVREWLLGAHFAWFVIDTARFCAAYRDDGRGRGL